MNHKFQIGDRVRIRDWGELIEEYGEKEYPQHVPNLQGAIKGMQLLCGRECIIKRLSRIERDGLILPVYYLQIPEGTGSIYWDERFFEPAEPSVNVTLTLQELRTLLNVKEG